MTNVRKFQLSSLIKIAINVIKWILKRIDILLTNLSSFNKGQILHLAQFSGPTFYLSLLRGNVLAIVIQQN